MYIIEDQVHCEYNLRNGYETSDLALNEIRQRVTIPWDEEPNRASCTSWRVCSGRKYQISEWDVSSKTYTRLKATPIVQINHAGVKWEPDFAPN